MMEMAVVFPAPFGPSSPKISPAQTLKSRPLTAGTAAPRYTFTSRSTCSTAAPGLAPDGSFRISIEPR